MWLDLPFAQVSRSVGENAHTTYSFPYPLSESEELQSWGCSEILLSFLIRFDGHFDQISNSSNVYLSLSRFWTVTYLVIFYQLPSVSKSRIPKNVWSVQSFTNTSVSVADRPNLKQHFMTKLCSFPPSIRYKENWLYKTTYNSYTVEDKRNSVCERMLVNSS